MTDDAQLVQAHLAGDKRAFDAIVSKYERRVWSICLRVCTDIEDARDAAQETFITAYRTLHSFRGDALLSTWLHRVAVNTSLDLIRRRNRRRDTPFDSVPDAPSDNTPPDELAIRSQRAQIVHRALAHLSDEHRVVIALHDLEELQYPEIAEVLNIPIGTVKSRLHRARVELARLLGHLAEVEPDREKHPLT